MNLLQAFKQEQRGSVAMAFGLSIVVLGLCAGLAIDMARVYSVSRKMQFALDSAALEGAKLMNELGGNSQSLENRAHATFNANTHTIDYREATLSGFSIVADTAASLINASVNVRVPATFARLAGIDDFAFIKVSSSSYNMARLEVVLALDVTGSMADVPAGDTITKIAALKSAAALLVNQLYDSATTDQNVRISVVPWSSGVHPGAYGTAATGSGGSNCVVERSGEGATTNSLPGPTTRAQPMPTSAAAIGYVCPSRPVTALQGRTRRNDILNEINALSPLGGTAGHIGAAWSWYMLSPSWAALHSQDSQPAAPSANVIKAAIVITDGIFNASFVGGTTPPPGTIYDDASYAMFQTICQNMRASDITVHTIALDLTDTRALSELSNCASSGTALTASNASQLSEVFSHMVAQLNSLRLTR